MFSSGALGRSMAPQLEYSHVKGWHRLGAILFAMFLMHVFNPFPLLHVFVHVLMLSSDAFTNNVWCCNKACNKLSFNHVLMHAGKTNESHSQCTAVAVGYSEGKNQELTAYAGVLSLSLFPASATSLAYTHHQFCRSCLLLAQLGLFTLLPAHKDVPCTSFSKQCSRRSTHLHICCICCQHLNYMSSCVPQLWQ
jgi:hypothetical protein